MQDVNGRRSHSWSWSGGIGVHRRVRSESSWEHRRRWGRGEGRAIRRRRDWWFGWNDRCRRSRGWRNRRYHWLWRYDRRGCHGQHRRHEVDRWNNGRRRQQWLWRRSQQRWNHNNWRNEQNRRNECDRWNEGKWWNNWRGRRNQQRWKQNGWGNDRDRGNECDRWNERERRNERDWYRVRAGLDALLRSVPQSLGWPLRTVPGIGRCERDRWDPEQRRHWLRWKWQR